MSANSVRPTHKRKVFTAEDRATLARCEAVIAKHYGPPGIARTPRTGITKRDRRPHDVYIHLDADDVVLYVGISLTIAERMGSHRASSSWWRQVCIIRVEHLPNRESALAREAELIAELRPMHNLRPAPDASTTTQVIRTARRTSERIVSSLRVDVAAILAGIELGETDLITPALVADLRAALDVLEGQLILQGLDPIGDLS